MRIFRIAATVVVCMAAFAFLLGCTGDGLSATATATTERIDQYLETTRPYTSKVTEVDNAVTDVLVELRRQELLPDPNVPSRTQLASVRRDGGEPRALDTMTTEEIIEALTTPAPIFIPESLRTALDDSIIVLTNAASDLDDTIVAWLGITPPPEMARLHSLKLVYFQSLGRYYEASLQKRQNLVETAEISPFTQMKVELALDQLSDNLAAASAEFRRVSSVYGPR